MVEITKKIALSAIENSKPTGLFFGTVAKVSPLEINVEQKITLGKNQLVLSRNVTKFDVSLTEKTTDETKIFEVDNELKIGEKVILFREQGGQKYIVLDRI